MAVAAVSMPIVWIYVNTLGYSYVYDDVVTLVSNEHIRDLSLDTLRRLFGGTLLQDYYPVFYLSLAVDRHVWGLHLGGFHLTNMVLHALCTMLVYALAFRLVRLDGRREPRPLERSPWVVAVAAALWFAVHPNHVEPVAWITGRKVLLAGLWGLLAVHLYLFMLSGDRGARWYGVGSWLCAALACMSNVYAVVVPVLLLLIDRVYSGSGRWRSAMRGLPFLAISLAAAAIKVASRAGGVAKPSPFESRTEWLLTTVSLYRENVGSLFSPFTRNVLYPNEVVDEPSDPAFVVGAILIVLTLVLVFLLRRRGMAWVGLLWFLLALAPTSQLARHHIFRADRYLYIPDMGAALLAGLAVAAVWRVSRRIAWRGSVIALCLTIGCLFGLSAKISTARWKDEASLWRASLDQNERNADAHQSLGCALMRKGEHEEALLHLQRAVELRPGHRDAHNTLCCLLLQMGRTREAIQHGRIAVQILPDRAEHYFSLARALAAQKEYAEAIRQYRAGLEIDPNDVGAWYYLASTLADVGDLKGAIEAYRRALELKPLYVEARFGLAVALKRSGQRERAAHMLERLIEDRPEFAEARCHLAQLAAEKQDYARALELYASAVEARPNLLSARYDLARLLAVCPTAELRDTDRALVLVRGCLAEEGRDDPTAWETLAIVHAAAGRPREARQAVQKAKALADKQGKSDVVRRIEHRLQSLPAPP